METDLYRSNHIRREWKREDLVPTNLTMPSLRFEEILSPCCQLDRTTCIACYMRRHIPLITQRSRLYQDPTGRNNNQRTTTEEVDPNLAHSLVRGVGWYHTPVVSLSISLHLK